MKFKTQAPNVEEAARLLELEKLRLKQRAEWFGTKIPEIEKEKVKMRKEKFGFYTEGDKKRVDKEKRKEWEQRFHHTEKGEGENEKIKARRERFNMDFTKKESHS